MPALISLLIPTRDRPQFVERALSSLREQSFRDFEVIVADNGFERPATSVVESFGDLDIRYVRPAVPLLMHDNWEFAADAARGEWIGVVADKVVLLPTALDRFMSLVQVFDPSLVSWWSENFAMSDPTGLKPSGTYASGSAWGEPVVFDPREELRWRYRMSVRRSDQGRRFCRGKICYGLYRRDLVARIKATVGRLFPPMSPDYTSMIAALACADRAIDAGVPLQITATATAASNGNLVERHDTHALAFVSGMDPSLRILETLPVPHVHASQHNIVAWDLAQARRWLASQVPDAILDPVNLVSRVGEDLTTVATWGDPETKRAQWRHWRARVCALSRADRLRVFWNVLRFAAFGRERISFGVLGLRVVVPVRPDSTVGRMLEAVLGLIAKGRGRPEPGCRGTHFETVGSLAVALDRMLGPDLGRTARSTAGS